MVNFRANKKKDEIERLEEELMFKRIVYAAKLNKADVASDELQSLVEDIYLYERKIDKLSRQLRRVCK